EFEVEMTGLGSAAVPTAHLEHRLTAWHGLEPSLEGQAVGVAAVDRPWREKWAVGTGRTEEDELLHADALPERSRVVVSAGSHDQLASSQWEVGDDRHRQHFRSLLLVQVDGGHRRAV